MALPPRSPLWMTRLTWLSADPSATTDWLRRLGFALSASGVVAFPSFEVHVVERAGSGDRLVEATSPDGRDIATSGAPPTAQPNGIAGLSAVGWATVDLERVLGDAAPDRFVGAPDDPHLGAFARRSLGRIGGLVLLEPNTEGRLAATLARHGEGPAALYLEAGSGGLDGTAAAVAHAGGSTSGVLEGPLGPSILLAGGPIDGPHLIVVEPGTIGA